ncbi:chemotaxis protein CheR [Sphingomonas sp. Leaf407]|uniref:CheR family methyltransferase n=1 Tax=unclassified Sphingomonas TaxID=196159 RepID=UPI0007022322|nr:MULTISPECIES: CheR family methyltransferase [unclassified Sphingomonas]KQN37410.1 chemotaxis protein CheR [Sphingomonas sp. Leaf42]KQT27779.1 chemotaxis protein CheR [Sphingomonas sp. Leaf407]
MNAPAAQPAPRTREFGFCKADHEAIAAIAHAEVGILLPEGKAQLVYGRLAPRVRACGLTNVGDYIALIGRDPAERARALDALTTNHTSFFREPHHFEDFAQRLWPTLAARLTAGDPVRLWSSACSSGEEPYSWLMAALGEDRAGATHLLRRDFRMLATDISPSVLATARAGSYPRDALANVPATLRSVWTQGRGDMLTVDPLLRDAIAFKSLNLLGDWPLRRRFDAILCRNVMIYFDEPTKERLLSRLADHLEVGGMLYIGHSERLIGPVARRFELVGRTAYLKVAA